MNEKSTITCPLEYSYQSAHLYTSRYCECFAALEFCRDCNCQNCKNTPKFEEERQKAIKSIKERNPSAFKSKISTKNGRHLRGCHCKKSGCKKKSAHLLPDPQTSRFYFAVPQARLNADYILPSFHRYCECFQAGILCGGSCKCSLCENRGTAANAVTSTRSTSSTLAVNSSMFVHSTDVFSSRPKSRARQKRVTGHRRRNLRHRDRGRYHMFGTHNAKIPKKTSIQVVESSIENVSLVLSFLSASQNFSYPQHFIPIQ